MRGESSRRFGKALRAPMRILVDLGNASGAATELRLNGNSETELNEIWRLNIKADDLR